MLHFVYYGMDKIDARKRRLSLGLKESQLNGVDGSSDKGGKTTKDDDDKGTNDEDDDDSDPMDESDEEGTGGSKRSRDVFESGRGNAFSLDFGESGSSAVRSGSSSSEEDVGDSDDGEEGVG